MTWNYQPVTQPQPQPPRVVGEAYVLEAQRNFEDKPGNLLFGFILLSVIALGFLLSGLVMGVLMVGGLYSSKKADEVLVGIAILALSAAVLGVGWTTVQKALSFLTRLLRISRYEVPTLHLSHFPLRGDDALELQFSRMLRKSGSLEQGGTLEARLVCAEVTEHMSGDLTEHEHQVLWQCDLPTVQMDAGDRGARASWSLTLPPDARASFYSPKSWLIWQFQLRQNLPGLPNQTVNFLLEVV